jgi:hypothetical protein
LGVVVIEGADGRRRRRRRRRRMGGGGSEGEAHKRGAKGEGKPSKWAAVVDGPKRSSPGDCSAVEEEDQRSWRDERETKEASGKREPQTR